MAHPKRIGILALQGDVQEHANAAKEACNKLKLSCCIIAVRTKEQLAGLDALIIPGGESTVLQRLCEREGMFDEIRKIKNIFGTCAGAILLAKTIQNKETEQRTLGLMDIEIGRNAYGRQINSFETGIETKLGKMNAFFIRAPKIRKTGEGIEILAKNEKEVVACEKRINGNYYLAATFHPELTTTSFHEYFLKQCFPRA